MTYVAAKISSPKGHFLTLEPQVSRCADKTEEGNRWREFRLMKPAKLRLGNCRGCGGKMFAIEAKQKKKEVGVKKQTKTTTTPGSGYEGLNCVSPLFSPPGCVSETGPTL